MNKSLLMRILRTLMLMILLNVLCLPMANAQFGWEQVMDDGTGSAHSMSVFGSYLCVGTENFADGCEVWRSSDGTSWNQVNTDGFGDADNDSAWSMAVFGSYLCVGTYNPTDGCEVWCSSDGTTWNQVNTDGFGDDNLWATSMAVFGSYLYVGTYNFTDGCEVWRFDDDSDDDGISNDVDNCPNTPNGSDLGTCVKVVGAVVMGTGVTCLSYEACGENEYCDLIQGDVNTNGIGDACECYADVDGDGNVYPSDLMNLLYEYGRTDCIPNPPCEADIDGDGNVFPSDIMIFLEEYGNTGCPVVP